MSKAKRLLVLCELSREEYELAAKEAGSRVEQLGSVSDYKRGDRVVASLKKGHPNFNYMIYDQFSRGQIGTVKKIENLYGVDHVVVEWDTGRTDRYIPEKIAKVIK